MRIFAISKITAKGRAILPFQDLEREFNFERSDSIVFDAWVYLVVAFTALTEGGPGARSVRTGDPIAGGRVRMMIALGGDHPFLGNAHKNYIPA